jgi:hypothetical protein
MPDGTWIPIVLFASAPVIAIGVPIARAYARRISGEGQSPALPSDVAARLERMEQAIDSIAVEVERISEGQRFTTKLLAERTPGVAGGALAGAPAALENPPPRGS